MSAEVIQNLTKENYDDLEKCIDQLKNIELCDSPEETHKDIFNEKFIKDVIEYAKNTNEEKSFFYIFRLLAEIAKADKGRQLCTNEEVIQIILNNLMKKSLVENEDISFQACRVFGNICFESEQARDIVLKLKGHELMMKLLTSLCTDVISSLTLSYDTTLPTSAYAILTKHLRVACGAFINLIDEHEDLQKLVLNKGVLDIIQKLLIVNYANGEIVRVTLNLLEYFSESTDERTMAFLSSASTWEAFYLVLKSAQDQEIVDTLFQILSCYAENDGNKEIIAKSEFPEKLLSLVDDFESNYAIKLADLACDFIILLLTGDKSMNILFSNADGAVYRRMRSWMNPDNSIKIQAAAAFAVCNFARSDANCISLVKSGIVKEIRTLLMEHPVEDKQHVLQHALFGSLTNLAITPSNRGALIEEGVTDICLSFLSTESMTVLFKMLATIRMLLDQNEKLACELGRNEEFLTKLNQSANSNDHEGIKCEALRIFASMVKNCHKSEVMSAILPYDLIQHLLKLLETEHVIMKNEALVALNILASSLDEKAFDKMAKEICYHLMYTLSLSSPSADTASSSLPSMPINLPVEVICNVLMLVRSFIKFENIKSELDKENVWEKLLEKYSSHTDERIKKHIEQFQSHI